MRANGIRKSVTVPKQVLHISDDEGNHRDFTVKRSDKNVLYTIPDIEAVLDALLSVVWDALAHGEHVTIHGYGTLSLRHRPARKLKHVATGEETTEPERYLPKFTSGSEFKLAAKVYEASIDDLSAPLPLYEEETDE